MNYAFVKYGWITCFLGLFMDISNVLIKIEFIVYSELLKLFYCLVLSCVRMAVSSEYLKYVVVDEGLVWSIV